MNYLKNNDVYSEYLKNKNVIVVGPSNSLCDRKLGKKIDSKDAIVRLNNSYPIIKKYHDDIGSRTDILYHTAAINTCLKIAANRLRKGRIQVLQDDNLKWFISKRDPNITKKDKRFLDSFMTINDEFNEKYKPKNEINVNSVFKWFLKDLQLILEKTEPNMSTVAICHLLTFDIKSLEIVGCDFYNTGYHPFYTLSNHIIWNNNKKQLVRRDNKARRTPKMPHDYKKQIKLLINIIENDNRIIIEKQILKLWKRRI